MLRVDPHGMAEVHRRRSHEADSAVTVLLVVPDEEPAKVRAGMLEALEAFGEFGPVLQRLELHLREGIVVGDPRTREARCHTQVDEELLRWSLLASGCRGPNAA